MQEAPLLEQPGLTERSAGLSAADSDEIVAWIAATADELRALPRGRVRPLGRSVEQLEAAGREIAAGEFGPVPFGHPWFWAAFTVVGE